MLPLWNYIYFYLFITTIYRRVTKQIEERGGEEAEKISIGIVGTRK
jgi:hypothetical protein